jgi:hypothetical protein
MLLNEFFGSMKFNVNGTPNKDESKERTEGLADEIFEFIINDDYLYKKTFFPIAEKIVKEATKEHDIKEWMPMVNKGCMKFYEQANMTEDPKQIFSKEFREEMCARLADHYQPDILKGIYNLGK